MIRYSGEKKTAKQAAQEIVADRILLAHGYWFEDCSLNADELSEKEMEALKVQINKIVERALKPCGYTLNKS